MKQARPCSEALAIVGMAVGLLAPTVVQLAFPAHTVTPGDEGGTAWHVLGWTVLLTAGVWAAVGRLRWVAWALIPWVFLGPWEALYYLGFRTISGPHVYGVLLDTHWEEVSSWLGPWLGPAVGAAMGWLLLCGWMLSVLHQSDRRWRGRTRWWLGGALAVTGGGMALLDHGLPASRAPDLQADPLVRAQPGLDQLEASYPWGVVLRLERFHRHVEQLRLAAARRQTPAWRASSPPSAAARQAEVHVLVIGETAAAARWGVYGAARDTTPQLATLSAAEWVRFEDAVSPAAATRESLPLMLTRRPLGAPLVEGDERSLVSVYREAGFRTVWISTQGMAGAHDTPISVLAREADEVRFISQSDYRGAAALDGALLPWVEAVLARAEPKVFLVLHTLGSHLHYANRYPEGREPFQPALQRSESPDIWRWSQGERLLNAYDNSVHYTDAWIAALIQRLRQTGRSITLTYAADHGESFPDGPCRRGGHGFPAYANYWVPFFIWASESWRHENSARWAALKSRAVAPVSTLALAPTVLGHARLAFRDPIVHADLGAPDWRPARRLARHFGDLDSPGFAAQACDAPRLLSPGAAMGAANDPASRTAAAARGGIH